MTQRLAFSALTGAFCGLLFGYDIGAMAGAAPDTRVALALSPAGLGLAVASALVGTIFASAGAGRLADAVGRRVTMGASGILYSVCILISASARGLVLFAAARFLCGIAIGAISVAAPMYLAEIAPPRLRGRIVGCFQLSLSIGVVAAFALGYILSRCLLSDPAWRVLLAIGILPALLFEACLLRAVDSPRWLAIRGRVEDVTAALTELGSSHPGLDEANIAAYLLEGGATTNQRLFSPHYIRPIALAVSLAVFNQLSGVNAILYYVLDIFRDLGAGRLNERADAAILSVVSLFVTMIAVLLIDKIGRKPLLLTGAAGMCCCLLLLPAVRHYNWPASVVIVLIACYNACFGFSQGIVIWVYLSEIFPLPVRGRGQSLGSTVHWATNAFVVGTFPFLASHLGSKIFLGLALLMVVQFFTILLLYPETRGRSLESSPPATADNSPSPWNKGYPAEGQ
jgi:sugar porter (SP) family MFS transporter